MRYSHLIEITLFNCYFAYRGIHHQDGLPLRVNELILMQGLFTSKIENERRLPKEQARISRSSLLY
jgi:hypothetical protein